MLINSRSGSDSEVTPMAFRQLGLGRLVGNPTAAAVIATGSYRLINGGAIRTPGSLVVTYDPTKPNNYGINLENYGVEPDVWAENTPEDELKGFDRELQAAIDEAMKMLKEGKYQYHDDRAGRRQVAISEILLRGEFTEFEGRSLAEVTENSARRHGVTEVHGGSPRCCAVTEWPVVRRPAAGRTNEGDCRNSSAPH